MSTKNNRILASGGSRYPFKVSDEYFDNLTARIMEQIDSVEQDVPENVETVTPHSAKLFSIHKNRRRNLWISTISVAASLVLIATVALKFIPMPSSTPVEPVATHSISNIIHEEICFSHHNPVGLLLCECTKPRLWTNSKPTC